MSEELAKVCCDCRHRLIFLLLPDSRENDFDHLICVVVKSDCNSFLHGPCDHVPWMDFDFTSGLLLRVVIHTSDIVLVDVVDVDVGEAVETTRVINEEAFQSR